MPYLERRALHDVVLVFEPCEEAREYAPDVVCHDLADAVLLLVVHEISAQRFCVYLGERYVNGLDEECEGRFVISERSLRTPFESLALRKAASSSPVSFVSACAAWAASVLASTDFDFFDLQRAEELLHGR